MKPQRLPNPIGTLKGAEFNGQAFTAWVTNKLEWEVSAEAPSGAAAFLLLKPSWTPVPSTISLIWTVLYPVILVSFGFVFVQAFRGKVGWKVALPFAINLIANLLFMPIFAGLRNVPLACVDILIVWATILWCVAVAWPVYRWVAVAQVSCFVWVSTATVIQVSITAMNWGNS